MPASESTVASYLATRFAVADTLGVRSPFAAGRPRCALVVCRACGPERMIAGGITTPFGDAHSRMVVARWAAAGCDKFMCCDIRARSAGGSLQEKEMCQEPVLYVL